MRDPKKPIEGLSADESTPLPDEAAPRREIDADGGDGLADAANKSSLMPGESLRLAGRYS